MSAASQITFVNECHSLQSVEEPETSRRITRPPNAFMLYRSDLLKRRAIPPEVERRQQNLSRIAGQCWNTLPVAEKDVWLRKAAAIRAEHRAKYPVRKARPFRKETKRLLAKDNRGGSAIISAHSSGRYRARRTRTPYCEGMFAALNDSKLSSPESQTRLSSPGTASESPLPSPSSFSPQSPFTSLAGSSRHTSPSPTFENSPIRGLELRHLPESPDSDALQRRLPQVVASFPLRKKLTETSNFQTPNEIDTSRETRATLHQCRDVFGFCGPHSGLGLLHSEPFPQLPLALPGSIEFPSAGHHPAENLSPLDNFNTTSAHFNRLFKLLRTEHF